MVYEPPSGALRRLKSDMERIRAELHRALDKADGNHLDAEVQKLSRDFDQLLSAYMRLKAARKRPST